MGVRFLLVLPCLFLASCRSLPPLASADASRVPLAYEKTLPTSFKAQQTLVFEFKPHWWWPTVRMTALGYAAVNRKTGDYAVVCLSPLGMKLFDVACSNGVTATRMMIPASGNQAAAGKAISDDIGNLYFNLIPTPDATVKQKRNSLVFRGACSEHEFNRLTGQLVRKEVWTDQSRSTLTFGDTRQENGYFFPGSMTLVNHHYGYRLTIRTVKLESLEISDLNRPERRFNPAIPVE
jgi:Protein of unknown function (DUF3261)